jgi:hypothetical protein
LTADNSGQSHQLNLLAPVMADRMAQADENIKLRRNAGFAATQALAAQTG